MSDGRCPFQPVRHHFGITSFGVNAWSARNAGDRIINEHDESDPDAGEELYLVTQGRAVFELDGDRVAAPAGTLVFAPPGVKRTAFAEEPETTLIALGGTPRKAYEPDGWEIWAPLNPLYDAGQYAEAADRGRQLVEAHPQYAGFLYNLACCDVPALPSGLEAVAPLTAISVGHALSLSGRGQIRSGGLDEPEEARDPSQAGGDIAEAAVPHARRRGGDGLLDRLRDVRDLEESGGHTRTVPPRPSRSNAVGSTPAAGKLDSWCGQARLLR